MIFFGDPRLRVLKKTKLCVDMAIEMVARMDELKGTWGKIGLRNDLEIRIGINTGYCTVGNCSDERLDYTAVGGTVNLASRLSPAESGSICVSEDTHLLIGSHFKFAEEKEIDVKGYLRKIRYYQLDRDLSENSNDVLQMKGNGFNISSIGKNCKRRLFKNKET